MYNTISVNPAYAGSRGTLNATILHRNQWAGLEGNPKTNTFSIHTPLRDERIGLGISYINDGLGDQNYNYVYGDFSYTVLLTNEVKMSFGLKGGVTNYNFRNPDPNDPVLGTVNQWNPNFGAGIFVGSNRWYAGLSSPRILNDSDQATEFANLDRNSYYAIGGLVFDLNETLKFKPTIISKFTNGAPASFDITANFLFNEKFWLGASYRFNDASNFGAMMDYQATKDIRVGYAYDLPTSTTRPYTGGTHEIILIYEFKEKPRGPIKSPRYF